MHITDQDIKDSNGEKENVNLLTNERSQILYSNQSEENYYGSLKEGKMDSKLVTGINETETKTFENLKSTVLLQMGLPESNKKLSQHTMVRGNTNKIRKTDEEATLHAFKCEEQKSPEARFVGIKPNL